MTKETLTPEKIRETAGYFQRSRVLLTAFELDIFTVVDGTPKTSAEVSRIIKTEHHATDRLMNALVALGYLEKKEREFSNSEGASRYLVKGKQDYMASLGHTVNMWYSWNSLTQSVYQGKPAYDRDINVRGDDWIRSFIAAMNYRGDIQAKEINKLLDLSKAKKLLDLGGGSGAFTVRFLKENENLEAVIFDLPNVVPVTDRYVSRSGLRERITIRAGNFREDDIGKGYDVIFLSAIVHMNSDEQNRKLLKKCAEALNTGGELIIQDFVMDENRTEPGYGAMFALNMLVNTEEGDTYTESEMKNWFKTAGLEYAGKKETSFGTSLVIARKE